MAEPAVDWTQCRIVERVEGKLGGAPVLKGTRLPVAAILDNFDAGLEPGEIAEVFEITATDVRLVLEFREQQHARLTGP